MADKLSAGDSALIADWLSKNEPSRAVNAEVSQGLSRRKYGVAAPGGFAQRKADPIKTDDPKFDMYCNALPATMRAWAHATSQDVRALYKEYRQLGRESLVAKYQESVSTWEASRENDQSR